MPSPPRRPAVTLTINRWPPESDHIISWGLVNIPCKNFIETAQAVYEISWYNHIYIHTYIHKSFLYSAYKFNRVPMRLYLSGRTNGRGGRTARKHKAFADTVGCRRHKENKMLMMIMMMTMMMIMCASMASDKHCCSTGQDARMRIVTPSHYVRNNHHVLNLVKSELYLHTNITWQH